MGWIRTSHAAIWNRCRRACILRVTRVSYPKLALPVVDNRRSAKNPKPSDCCSISGMPSQAATGSDGVGCWVEVGKVVVVVGRLRWHTRSGEGVGS